MKKSELEDRLKVINAVQADSDDDFEAIVSNISSSPADKRKVVFLPVDKMIEYTDEHFLRATGRPQPFKTYSENRLESLAKSIAEHGVIDPITVRQLTDGTYQVLAGRHRRRAAIQCGKTTIPAIIRNDIDDYQAAMIMLDTNIERRPDLTYSERAYAYKMRIELQGHQGKRTDLDDGQKVDSLSELGKENKDSRRTVAYLIRLTYLIPDLLEMVDNGTVGFKIAVAISYLSTDTQHLLLSEVLLQKQKVKLGQIKELRSLDECGIVNQITLNKIFQQPPEKILPSSITISGKKLQEFADILPDKESIESLFLEFLKNYRCKTSS